LEARNVATLNVEFAAIETAQPRRIVEDVLTLSLGQVEADLFGRA
jgi:hypothetical protein